MTVVPAETCDVKHDAIRRLGGKVGVLVYTISRRRPAPFAHLSDKTSDVEARTEAQVDGVESASATMSA
jgi:hypothetical protein